MISMVSHVSDIGFCRKYIQAYFGGFSGTIVKMGARQ